MQRLFSFIVILSLCALSFAQLHPERRDDPYEFHYLSAGAEGYLETIDLQGKPQRFALAEIAAWTWYAHPPRGRNEDRMVIEARFEGTNIEVRAYLRWEGTRWVLSLNEDGTEPYLGVGHDRDEGSYTQYGYIHAESADFQIAHSAQGEIASFQWEYRGQAFGPYPGWIKADQQYVTDFEVQGNLKTDFYLMKYLGTSRYTPDEARNLDTTPYLARINPQAEARFFADPEGEMAAFTQALVAGVEDDFLALKIIHDWVTSRIYYDKECYQDGRNLCPTDPYGTVSNRKSVCEGYADLMEEMGLFAELPIRSIGGFVKGGGFYEEGVPSRHAYNIVFVNNQWLLLDATHDTGNYWIGGVFTEGKRHNNKLFVPMEYTWWYYHPYRREYQFREPLLTYEEFERMEQDGMNVSFVYQELHHQQLALKAPLPFRIKTEDEVYSIYLKREQATKLSWSPSSEEKVPLEVFVHYLPSEIRIDLSSSTGGPHRLFVHGKSPGMERAKTLMALYVQGMPPVNHGFPKAYWDWTQRGGEILSPILGGLSLEDSHRFELRLPGAEGAQLGVENKDLFVEMNQSGETFWLELPRGRLPAELEGQKLRIYVKYPDLGYSKALLEWELLP